MLSCGRARDALSHTLNVPTNGGLRQLGAIGSGKPRLTVFPFLVRIFPAGEEGWAITAPGLNFVTLRFVCVRFAAMSYFLAAGGAAGLAGGNKLVFCVTEKFTGLVGIVVGVGLVPCDPLTYGTLLAGRGRVDAGGV